MRLEFVSESFLKILNNEGATVINKLFEDQDDPPKRRIMIDLDGVIHRYSKGFHDGTMYDPPADGTHEALEELKRAGYDLWVFTARINAKHGETGEVVVRNYLDKYDLSKYFTGITDKKLPALFYIDDSAIHHTDWNNTMKELSRRLKNV